MGKDNYQRLYLIALFALIAALHWSCKEDKGDEPVPDTDEKSIHINLAYLDFPAEGGMEEVDFSAETDWQVVNPADTWLQVTPTSGTSGQNLTLQLQTDKNEDSAERQAKIIVRSTAGNSADTLTVRQAGTTRYVDIDWENNTTLTQFDLNSGNVSFTYSGTVPDFTPEVSTIVVPTDSLSYIRVVKSATVSGNSISLQTEEGDMTDLFMDQEFTLSIMPMHDTQITKSGQISTTDHNGIIHPSKIIAHTENGQHVTLYDAIETRTNGIIMGDTTIWNKKIDWSGKPIFTEGVASIYWEKFVIDMNLDGFFFFGFNSDYETKNDGLKVKIGTLEHFSFTLKGSVAADMLLAAEVSKEFTKSFGKNILPFYFPRFTIWFPVGPVTLPITVDIDVLSDASVNAKANAKATAGCYGNIGLEVGMEYHSGSTKPILKPEYSFGLHPVTLETFGSMEAQGSVYPELQLRLFNFMGPNIAFKPSLYFQMEAGSIFSTDLSKNYIGWDTGSHVEMNVEAGLSLEFIGQPINMMDVEYPVSQFALFQMPTDIELVSPSYDITGEIGEAVDVRFRVTGIGINKESFPTKDVFVAVKTKGAKTDQTYYKTNDQGEVTIKYTPETADNLLEAYIVDAYGVKISKATFKTFIEVPPLVGTWQGLDFEMTVGDDQNGSAAHIKFRDWIVFREDGTYSYIENPEQTVMYWYYGEYPQSWLIYRYIDGKYTYNEETHQLVIQAGPVIDKSVRNGEFQEFFRDNIFHSIFAKSGTYTLNINKDGSIGILLPGTEGEYLNCPRLK